MQAKEWRKRPRNNVENIENDKGMVERSLLSNIIHLGSSRPLQVRARFYPNHQLFLGVFLPLFVSTFLVSSVVFLFSCCFVLMDGKYPFWIFRASRNLECCRKELAKIKFDLWFIVLVGFSYMGISGCTCCVWFTFYHVTLSSNFQIFAFHLFGEVFVVVRLCAIAWIGIKTQDCMIMTQITVNGVTNLLKYLKKMNCITFVDIPTFKLQPKSCEVKLSNIYLVQFHSLVIDFRSHLWVTLMICQC